MRTLKEQLGRLASSCTEGASEAEGKRRAVMPDMDKFLKMDRPGSLVKVLGFILFSPGQLKRGFGLWRR